MDDSKPPDLKKEQSKIVLSLQEYMGRVNGLITYVDLVLEDPLRGSKGERIEELCDLSCLLLKTEQDVTKLLENNNESLALNSSQFNSIKGYLMGRRDLLIEQINSI